MSSWDVQEWLLLYLPCLDFCFSLFSLATVGSLFFFLANGVQLISAIFGCMWQLVVFAILMLPFYACFTQFEISASHFIFLVNIF